MVTPREPSEIERIAQTEALFNSIGDGLIVSDEFGRITRVNPAALKILGYKESELLHKWWPRTLVAADEEGEQFSLIDRPITQAFLTGKSISQKLYYQRKDGSQVPVAITVSPIILKKRPVGAIEVFRDISIEYEVDRMKSEFISLASHQLRTPLSAIKTYTHMLLDGYMGGITKPQRRSLQTIMGAADRMNELISTLLNITRIESGNVTVAPKQTNLSQLAQDVMNELSHSAAERGITITLDAPKKPAIIRTDSLILKEVLTNLVNNAIKYSPAEASVTIRIKTLAQSVRIAVEDQGFGIPKAAQEQIFTKFFRAHNIVRRETTGTGLGLYLVKGLVEQLGGSISFVSEENKGSIFYLTLPKQGPRRNGTTTARKRPAL